MSGQELVDELKADIDAAVEDYRRIFPEPCALAPNLDLACRARAVIVELEAVVNPWTEMAARRHRALGEAEARAECAEQERDAAVKELAEAHTHFAIQEGRIRQAFEERDAAYKQAWDEAVAVFKPERARAERAEQKSAELAAVIAEALATKPGGFNDTPRLGAILRILSAASTEAALSAYTTRVREEALAAFQLIRERIAMEDVPIHVAADIDQYICERAGVWSEIPEGQNNE